MVKKLGYPYFFFGGLISFAFVRMFFFDVFSMVTWLLGMQILAPRFSSVTGLLGMHFRVLGFPFAFDFFDL